ncbi:fumarylacetoacetate hydrolase family protein [Microbacterium sp. ZXX196]|uniref:fumarylacetoacetate hydrolase family protein n=1 Tax=Microbacterium sp. ZXX196 TaxID=2609291 RepID=UPI001326F3C1|nr:hypothetical protein [Microbacterium sp. ZXX196]
MRLGTLRIGGRTRAVRVEAGIAVEIQGMADVGALLARPDWRRIAQRAQGTAHALSALAGDAWAPVVPAPSKIVCVGLNYRAHILEMGRELPEFPTLFAKYADALIGAGDPIRIPREAADTLDWEGELVVVVGEAVRFATPEAAARAIAGYTVMNDITVRGHQRRTTQWLQGKTFEATTPLGPWLVTADVAPAGSVLTTRVGDETVQSSTTDDLVFGAAELVSSISRITTLRPGDIIATGTPGGVGAARTPPRYLADGETVEVAIEGIGAVRNRVEVVDPTFSVS